MALPNGLPAIVCFLSGRRRTAAPLNPGYREDEFRFYLGDTTRSSWFFRRMAPTMRVAQPVIQCRS